jgi:hypothetical protein
MNKSLSLKIKTKYIYKIKRRYNVDYNNFTEVRF